jgi:hypothetical protein
MGGGEKIDDPNVVTGFEHCRQRVGEEWKWEGILLGNVFLTENIKEVKKHIPWPKSKLPSS